MKNPKVKHLLLIHDKMIARGKKFLKDNLLLILILSTVAILAYGYELFNLNLTIDDETASFQSTVPIWNIEIGRWANYILKRFIFPFSVIPFVPLFLTLSFHVAALLLMFESLEVKKNIDRVLAGVLGVAWPGMTFVYSFSTTNYVFGIGLLCISLSLLLFVKGRGPRKYWSVVPAAFAIGIYQTFIFALVLIYILYILYMWDKAHFKPWKNIKSILISLILSFFIYYGVHIGLLFSLNITESSYVSSKFDLPYLLGNWKEIISKVGNLIYRVYAGDNSIYGIEIKIFGVLLLILGVSVQINVWGSKVINKFNKIIIFFLLATFLILPFTGGLLTKGYIPLRSLNGMPIIISGLMLLGLKYRVDIVKSLIALVTLICLFQFMSSSNHLFAASQMAFEEDRILGTLLIDRIEEEKSETNPVNLQYFEMIGYPYRLSYPLVPRIETSGASFFGWDQGNSERVVLFLQTLGYYGLEPLPLSARAQIVNIASSMPKWPSRDSVAIYGNIVIVRFGSYSKNQIQSICSLVENEIQLAEFCP